MQTFDYCFAKISLFCLFCFHSLFSLSTLPFGAFANCSVMSLTYSVYRYTHTLKNPLRIWSLTGFSRCPTKKHFSVIIRESLITVHFVTPNFAIRKDLSSLSVSDVFVRDFVIFRNYCLSSVYTLSGFETHVAINHWNCFHHFFVE